MKREQAVRIDVGPLVLEGDLVVPENAGGLVLFAHGSGSSRRSPRNRYVASTLHEGSLATLLFDLLTEEEEQVDRVTAHLRFDVELLGERLAAATDWIGTHREVGALAKGYFGSSTGAAAALIAAARDDADVGAVVSRGGRPDLALPVLHRVRAPTLFIVGGFDFEVIRLNEQAYAELPGDKRLEIVPRATHLFEEPGTLESAAALARGWFERHLVLPGSGRGLPVEGPPAGLTP